MKMSYSYFEIMQVRNRLKNLIEMPAIRNNKLIVAEINGLRTELSSYDEVLSQIGTNGILSDHTIVRGIKGTEEFLNHIELLVENQ